MNAGIDQNSSDLLKGLHWLPVHARIMFKNLILVFRGLNGTASTYLQNMLTLCNSK